MGWFDSLIFSILIFCLPFNQTQRTPVDLDWKIESDGWELQFNPHFEARLKASSKVIPNQCEQEPEKSVHLPFGIYSIHEVSLDGIPYKRWGSDNYKYTKKFQDIYIPCKDILNSKVFSWTMYSPVYQQAKVRHFPKIVEEKTLVEYANVDIKVSIGIFLILFSIILLLVFWRRTDSKRALTAFFTAFVWGILLTNSSHQWFVKVMAMTTQSKISAIFYWSGTLLIYYNLLLDKYLPRILFKTLAVYILTIFGTFVLFSNEVSSNFLIGPISAFISNFILVVPLVNVVRNFGKDGIIGAIILVLYALFSLNEAFVFLGYSSYGSIHYAILCIVLYQFIRINSIIQKTFSDKDFFEEKAETFGGILKNVQMIAHDVKRPVNMVKILVKNIRKIETKAELDKFLERYAGYIDSSVEDVNEMVKDLVTVNTHIKHVSGNHTKFDLQLLINEIKQELAHIEKNKLKTIDVVNNISENILLYGNRNQIKRVFINIIHNAIISMDKKGIIKVDSYKSKQAIEIYITNSGTFIPEEKRLKIFQPYAGENKSGSGLGLTICKEIISSHKGEISVNSWKEKIDEFTSFNITLPDT